MALTQIQIIQSLGEAMSWLDKELSWGVPITELTHLSGRIGELYAALLTNGQMAVDVNQKGYDVVSASGERISVKTTGRAGSSGQVSFNSRTLNEVDRIMIFKINIEEMQIETLFDGTTEEARELMFQPSSDAACKIAMSKLVQPKIVKRKLESVQQVTWKEYTITELENGTIEVTKSEELQTPTKPYLREIAEALSISITNTNGNPLNTRQLGTSIIRTIGSR
ncbi:hypothetical protein DRW07_01985 [Alteromonas sediminis]|uniref:DUF6998 domain-containing protein n=1 Tax=Alteromonas sediminis TaxID=2259342 RepID=A0A3N5YQ87_9ALTE|nr:hypothetical protein [Alteromonas sediminis]RPJ68201.1 hypothetical protein DRW07_01985 [Alteromonas sediminis]